MNSFLGIDLGTTAVKAVLFGEDGSELCSVSAETELMHPEKDFTEQDPSGWYETPCALIREITRNFDPVCIRAAGISSQGISFVPADENHLPLCAGISWLDTRAQDELRELTERIAPERLFGITGKHPSELYTLPKLMWLKKHRAEIFGRAALFLMPMDYFIARTTGCAVTDPTMAGGTMLFDIGKRQWSAELAALGGIPICKLPPVRPTGTKAGTVGAGTVLLTGLKPGTAVAVGAQDQKIAALGAGIGPGTATLSLGTAGALEVLCGSKSETLPAFLFTDGEQYVLEGCVNTFGAAIKWARDTVFPDLGYRDMDLLAEKADPGCGGVRFHPHLSGAGTPHFGKKMRSGWTGVTLSTTGSELIRAVYEGLACEVRMNLDEAEKAGARIDRLKIFGGAAKSGILCRILSDFCEKDAEALPFAETAALGAAMTAAKCIGFPTDKFGQGPNTRHYRPENTENSKQIFEDYRKGNAYE